MLENPETGESYMRTIREDPWGTPYEFRVVGPKKFLIVSAGPDRVFDTDDDLSWPWSDDK